ncbi:MAG: lipopolysaccharide transport periplasmic protein LptA [Candidatus Methylomirabilales bacterium]
MMRYGRLRAVGVVLSLIGSAGAGLSIAEAGSPLGPPPPGPSQPAASGVTSGRAPTTITADRLEVDRKVHRAVYSGNVVLHNERMTVTADRMDFLFDDRMENVTMMIAEGKVRIEQADGSRAVSEKATYYVEEERVVLEGRPRAWRDDSVVTGSRMTMYLREDRQVVEAGEQERVQAVIYPTQTTPSAQ